MNKQSLIEVNQNKMSGMPVFNHNKVPLKNLFYCIEGGETIYQFLDQFPAAFLEQVNGISDLSRKRLFGAEVGQGLCHDLFRGPITL